MTEGKTLWHVRVTVSGQPGDLSTVHDALQRLKMQQPFMHSLRYDADRAEVSYWEEGDSMLDAASLALRMWNEHRASAELPAWEVVGLEVVQHDTFRSRGGPTPLAEADVQPRRF